MIKYKWDIKINKIVNKNEKFKLIYFMGDLSIDIF